MAHTRARHRHTHTRAQAHTHAPLAPNLRPPDLTELGQAQAQSLNSMLAGGGWFKKVTGGRAVRAVVSPLTR